MGTRMSEHLASSLIELMPADVRYEFYTRRLRFNRRNVGKGSGCVSLLFEFIAGKRPVEFRFPEAATRHEVLTTLSRPWRGYRFDGRLPFGAVAHPNHWPATHRPYQFDWFWLGLSAWRLR